VSPTSNPSPPAPGDLAPQLLALMDSSQQGFALFDQGDRLTYANARFRTWLGLQPDEFPTWVDLMRMGHARRRGTRVDSDDFETWLASARSRRGKLPFRLVESDLQERRWLLTAETTLPDGGMLCVLTDITDLSTDQRQLRQQRDKARKAALTDELTGLSNRRHLMERLHALLAQEPQGLAVALLDLDHFKRVNDTHGHDSGDIVLRRFARVLQQFTRRDDVSGRLGGEEFLLIMRGLPRLPAAQRVRALLDAVRTEAFPDLPMLQCTASAGLVFSQHGESPGALLLRADKLLYAAKADGRDHCMVEAPSGDGMRATDFLRL
jgi:diguanylate cyclase (GGDEF)-like protein